MVMLVCVCVMKLVVCVGIGVADGRCSVNVGRIGASSGGGVGDIGGGQQERRTHAWLRWRRMKRGRGYECGRLLM